MCYSLNRMLLHSAILLLRFCVGSVVEFFFFSFFLFSIFFFFFSFFYILRTCVNKDSLIFKKILCILAQSAFFLI